MAQSVSCVIKNVRFSYANLWKPRTSSLSDKPKYGVVLLIPKSDTKTIEEVRAKINECWELNKGMFNGKKPPKFKDPVHDGDTEKDLDDNPEFAGHWFINTSSACDQPRPGIVTNRKDEQGRWIPITVESDFYSGCFGHASVNFNAYDTAGNKGIGAYVNLVMKTKDGEALAGRSSAETAFADVEETEDSVDDML